MVITEISKEVDDNNIGRLNAYSREYVSRGLPVGDAGDQLKHVMLMVALEDHIQEDHIQEVVVLDVVDLVPVHIQSFLFQKKNMDNRY